MIRNYGTKDRIGSLLACKAFILFFQYFINFRALADMLVGLLIMPLTLVSGFN
jgi:hypothetical protein